MQKPWRDAAYWFAPHGLLSLLSYRTQDHQPRDGTMRWALPGLHAGPEKTLKISLVFFSSSIANEENTSQLDLKEAFSQLRFPPFR